MSGSISGADRAPSAGLGLRFALRELRGGLRGFYVFIACIALGVMAIAGVGSLAESIAEGLSRDGAVILGGDAAFSLMHREAGPEERRFLAGRGELSTAATMRAMVRTADGRSALVELKAVDAAYPLYGTVELGADTTLADALAERGGTFGAAVDPALLQRLDLAPGARVSVGSAVIELRTVLKKEPDRLAGGIGFGPRLLISEAALRATGLLQPGSLVQWHYRLKLPAGAGEPAERALVTQAAALLPDAGWQIRTRRNASPQLERNIERFTQYLTLVGLTALLVGGVGVANAAKSHLDRRRDVIATLKALGATGARVFAIYTSQILVLAGIGSVAGAALGATLPFAVSWGFGAVIPIPMVPSLHPAELLLAVLYGLLTAFAFALWPLGRSHDVPVSALFRDQVAADRRWPRRVYVAATVAVLAALAGLAVWLAYDRRIAAIFVGVAAAVFVALRLLALGVMWAASRLPRPRQAMLRLAIANIHRPGALTPTVILSLGLGLALLVTVVEIDGNLRREFTAALPDKAPSFFFVDIPSADAGQFETFLRSHAPGAAIERVPMLRGRIVAANGVRAEDLRPAPDAGWVLQSDRGITYAQDVPGGSRVVAGEWWARDHRGPPLVSLERRIADGLGLKIGDELTVNVLGRNMTARIANLRTVDWQNLGINFVLVFSPDAFRGAPHTHIATLTYPAAGTDNAESEGRLLRQMADRFPMVTSVRVRDAIDAVGAIVGNLVVAIRGASTVTLLSAMLVLGGALAAGHRYRVYDAVILKTLGATRSYLLAAYALEYLLLGTVAAAFGVAAGSVTSWLVLTKVMNVPFAWLPGPAMVAACAAAGATVALGLIGTFAALRQKPASVLRNL